jgi:hypothetical protein
MEAPYYRDLALLVMKVFRKGQHEGMDVREMRTRTGSGE